MGSTGSVVLIVMVAATAAFTAAAPGRDEDRSDLPLTAGVAVVELFTSEGCSSCPPADEALMDLVERSTREGIPVFALSFHVDYWDRLGWKDPFASGRWSERQRQYARGTGDRVYTPQCVVNGTKSFVGSDTQELKRAVSEALAAPAAVQIEAASEREGATMKVRYSIIGDVADGELNIVLVERGLAGNVSAGENKGRRLTHTNVVRAMRTVELNADVKKGSIVLEAGKVADPANAEVILFVQRPGPGRVLGAARI